MNQEVATSTAARSCSHLLPAVSMGFPRSSSSGLFGWIKKCDETGVLRHSSVPLVMDEGNPSQVGEGVETSMEGSSHGED